MKLIVSDFDGTFYDENYDENIKFIDSIRDKYDFVIATGRFYDSLKEVLKTYCKYYICNDGSYILNENKEVIYKKHINPNSIKIVYERMKELGYNDYFFDYISHFDKELKDNVNKLSIHINSDTSEDDLKYLLKDLDDVYGYISTNWINILGINSNKETAIKELIKLNNYEEVIVLGNEINDHGMIKEFNGYLITDNKDNKYKTIKNFLEINKKL